jgi:hypothetical protein
MSNQSTAQLTLGGASAMIKLHETEEKQDKTPATGKKATAKAKAKVKKPSAPKDKTTKPTDEKTTPKRTRKPKAVKPEAETEVKKPEVVVAAPPEPAKAKPLSLKDRLLAKKETFDGAALSERLRDYKEVTREPELMAQFAELIERADEVGIASFSFDRQPMQAMDEWFQLNLQELVDQLKKLSRRDEDVNKLLYSLKDFLENNLVGDTFWRVVNDVVRPFAAINNRGELQKALNRLVSTGLVEVDSKHYDSEAIVIYNGSAKFVYSRKREWNPETGKPEPALVILIGWQFAKKANEKIKDQRRARRGELKAIQDEATLTPKDVLTGSKKNGTFFVPSGTSCGLLMEKEGRKIRVLKSIDVKINSNLPTKWVDWDASPDSWSSRDSCFAFKTWRDKTIASNE